MMLITVDKPFYLRAQYIPKPRKNASPANSFSLCVWHLTGSN